MDKSIYIDKEKADEFKAAFPTPQKMDKKFNMKIRKTDFDIVDEIAELEKVPRSVIFNFLIHENLVSNFLALVDEDTRLLIAEKADEKLGNQRFTDTWQFLTIANYLNSPLNALFHNIGKYNEASTDWNFDIQFEASGCDLKNTNFHSQSYNNLMKVMKWSETDDQEES